MAEQLYALQRDLDMITDDVQNLKRSYNTVDRIGKRFDDLWLEQLAQSAGMRRLEERLDKVEKILRKICSKLKIKLDV